jgi:hypothetical protein
MRDSIIAITMGSGAIFVFICAITYWMDKATRAKSTWQHVAAGADTAGVSVALQMVPMLENVECRPK